MPQGPREGHDPPLQTPANARSNRRDTSLGAAVGRDALIPPHPAAAQTPAGGMNPAPTDRGNPAANRKPRAAATYVGAHIVRPGNPAADRKPRAAATQVGDDARIVPGTPRYRKVPREGHDPPLQTPANARSNRGDTSLGAVVGRDALIPPHPAAARTPAGGMNPAPTDRGNPATNRKPRATATYVGDDARIVPGNPAMPQGPREGHDPPLQTPANARSNRGDTSLGAVVGRDALIPPHPAAAQTHVGADSISAQLVSAQGGVPAYPMRGGKSEPNWDAVNPCEKGCESLPLLLRSERRRANRLPFIQYLYRPYLNLTPR